MKISEMKLIKELRFLFSMVKGNMKLWSVAVVLNSLQSLLVDILYGYAMKYTLDSVSNNDYHQFIIGCIFMIVGAIYMIFGLPFFSYLMYKSIGIIRTSLKDSIFDKVIHFQYEKIDNNHSGEFLTLLQNDVNGMLGLFNWSFVAMMQAIVAGVGATVIIFYINWQLGVISMVTGIILLLSNYLFIKKIRTDNDILREIAEERMTSTIDLIDNFVLIKMYNIAKTLINEINIICSKKAKKQFSLSFKKSILNILQTCITDLLFFSGLLVTGSYLIINKQISFGSLMLIIQMGNSIMFFFGWIGKYIVWSQYSFSCLHKVYEKCNGYVDFNNEKVLKSVDLDSPDIKFENVYFNYDGSNSMIIENICEDITFPSRISITGENGAGKTTILKLLSRLYYVKKGSIYINNININDISRYDLARTIAYVPQDSFLFEDTIYNNIVFGLDRVSDESVIKAAKEAEIFNFINELEHSFHTILVEGGRNLSGGQRQRIALARALLRSPSILLLDEFGSNIDRRTTEQIYSNILKNYPNMTVIVEPVINFV